ncbi:protein HID1 isoform X3 [Eurytemora carolleeae]|uniref:protein HID1 isoform X3 n=1 Tax=Eurytemora carolleeae TaxID=1294199 RepID=UPI000C762791|nr:protein HID1 isoform X3 [Eurytemora carolleeae]|eukprot:XP_023346398.1 protein HID1-like isoform X3 [Eurytemora affinis]
MTCLFSGFTKGCFPSSNRISIRQESKAAPDKTETVKDKPVFCIYDSDESDTERPSPNILSAIYPSSSTSFSSSTDSVNYTTLRSTNQSLKGRSRKSIQPRIPLSNSTVDTSTDSTLEITHVPYVRQSCYPSLHRSTFISSSRGIEAHGRDMGAGESKTSFRQAVNLLDENKDLWEQLDWEKITSIQDVFAFLPGAEIRRIREENPSKLAQLCCKLVEKLTVAVETSCRTKADNTTVINSCRILTRLIPYIFECPEWNSFFWSSDGGENSKENENHPLAYKLIMALSDLLFCPDFTVSGSNSMSRDEVDDLDSLDSCEYIWEKGVGFAQSQQQIPQHHHNRSELLCLLLTCFSQTMYLTPHGDINMSGDRWVTLFTSPQNRSTTVNFLYD